MSAKLNKIQTKNLSSEEKPRPDQNQLLLNMNTEDIKTKYSKTKKIMYLMSEKIDGSRFLGLK